MTTLAAIVGALLLVVGALVFLSIAPLLFSLALHLVREGLTAWPTLWRAWRQARRERAK